MAQDRRRVNGEGTSVNQVQEAGERLAFLLCVRSEGTGAPVRWEVDFGALLPDRPQAWADPDTWRVEHEGRPMPFRADLDTLDGRLTTLRFRAPAAGDLPLTATCVVHETPRPAPPVPPDQPRPLIGAGDVISLGSTAAVGDLHVGLQTAVDFVDWYGRGQLDLLVTSHGHEGGAFVYAATAATDSHGRPIFRCAGRLPGFGDDHQSHNARLRAVDFRSTQAASGDPPSGHFDLLESRGNRVLWHRHTGKSGAPAFASPVPLEAGGEPFTTGATAVRVQSLCPVDLGDGRVSLIVGTNDWSDYWPKDVGAWEDQPGYRPYEDDGTWRGGPLRGRLLVLRNTSRGPEPSFAAPVELCHEDGTPLEVYGLAGPATLPAVKSGASFDLVVSDFLDRLWYFRNTGRTGPDGTPRFAPRTPVRTTGELAPAIDRPPTPPFAAPADYPPVERLPDELVLPTCMHSLAISHRPGVGTELVVGAEDGYIRALRLVKRTPEGVPVVGPPMRLQEFGAHLSVGAKACPNVVDWDGDGRDDLVLGNAAGQVLLCRATGAPGATGDGATGDGADRPFAPPEPFLAGDQPLWLMAGAPGTIQGPSEVRWGYINPGVGRWSVPGGRDALAIVCGDSLGQNTLYLRSDAVQPAGEAPRVSRGRRLHILRGGQWEPLVTRWRCRPQLVDWGDGVVEYLQVAANGQVSRYRLLPDGPTAEDGQARVEWKDALRYDDGSAVQLDSDFGGRIGRLKLAVVDWDGDRLPVLLVGGSGQQPVGVNTLGKSSVFLLRNVGAPGRPVFARPELIPLDAGQPARFGGHSCVPAPCVLDRSSQSVALVTGKGQPPDLLVGSENGRVYAYRRAYIAGKARVDSYRIVSPVAV